MKWLLKRWLKQLWEIAMEVLDEWVKEKEKVESSRGKPFQFNTKKPQLDRPVSFGINRETIAEVKQRAHDILKGNK